MKKIIIGLAVLALIVFGGYKLLNNISSGDAITKSVQFDYENVQQYDGTKAYVEVNGNKPYFTEKELTKKAYVKYAALDTLKRVSSTMGCIGTETMPEEDEKKDGLGDNYPTGWNSEKYDCIDGDGYSQKRTSCIARFLSGAYTEKRNIIAASPFMSNNMNVYEVRIARYIERTSNHVMLRVTPIYKRHIRLRMMEQAYALMYFYIMPSRVSALIIQQENQHIQANILILLKSHGIINIL